MLSKIHSLSQATTEGSTIPSLKAPFSTASWYGTTAETATASDSSTFSTNLTTSNMGVYTSTRVGQSPVGGTIYYKGGSSGPYGARPVTHYIYNFTTESWESFGTSGTTVYAVTIGYNHVFNNGDSTYDVVVCTVKQGGSFPAVAFVDYVAIEAASIVGPNPPATPVLTCNLTGTKTNNNTVLLSWTYSDPDADPQYSVHIAGYIDDTLQRYGETFIMSETSKTITIPYSGYWTFYVSVSDGANSSYSSNGVDFAIDISVPPDPSNETSVYNITTNSVSLQWASYVDDPYLASPFKSVAIYAQEWDGSAWVDTVDIDSNGQVEQSIVWTTEKTSHIITGLKPNRTYRVVAGRYQDDVGNWGEYTWRQFTTLPISEIGTSVGSTNTTSYAKSARIKSSTSALSVLSSIVSSKVNIRNAIVQATTDTYSNIDGINIEKAVVSADAQTTMIIDSQTTIIYAKASLTSLAGINIEGATALVGTTNGSIIGASSFNVQAVRSTEQLLNVGSNIDISTYIDRFGELSGAAITNITAKALSDKPAIVELLSAVTALQHNVVRTRLVDITQSVVSSYGASVQATREQNALLSVDSSAINQGIKEVTAKGSTYMGADSSIAIAWINNTYSKAAITVDTSIAIEIEVSLGAKVNMSVDNSLSTSSVVIHNTDTIESSIAEANVAPLRTRLLDAHVYSTDVNLLLMFDGEANLAVETAITAGLSLTAVGDTQGSTDSGIDTYYNRVKESTHYDSSESSLSISYIVTKYSLPQQLQGDTGIYTRAYANDQADSALHCTAFVTVTASKVAHYEPQLSAVSSTLLTGVRVQPAENMVHLETDITITYAKVKYFDSDMSVDSKHTLRPIMMHTVRGSLPTGASSTTRGAIRASAITGLSVDAKLNAKDVSYIAHMHSVLFSGNTKHTVRAASNRVLSDQLFSSDSKVVVTALQTLLEAINAPFRSIAASVEIFFNGLPIEFNDNDISSIDLLEELAADSNNPFGAVSSNELSLSLSNIGSRFTPTNVNSPYYGMLKPNVKIKAYLQIERRANLNYSEFSKIPLGTFYSGDWNASSSSLECNVDCYDKMYFIGQTPVASIKPQINTTSGDMFKLLFSKLGLTGAEYYVSPEINAPIKIGWWPDGTAISTMQLLAVASKAYVYVDRNEVIRVEPITMYNATKHTVTDDIIHEATNPTRYSNTYSGVQVASCAPSLKEPTTVLSLSGIEVQPGTTVIEQTFSEEPVGKIDTVHIPNSVNVVVAKVGVSAHSITLVLLNTGVSAETIDVVVTGRVVTSSSRVSIISDPVIEDIIGSRLLKIDNHLLQDDAHATGYATDLFNIVKDPNSNISMQVRGNPLIKLGDTIAVSSPLNHINSNMRVYRSTLKYDGGLEGSIEGFKVGGV